MCARAPRVPTTTTAERQTALPRHQLPNIIITCAEAQCHVKIALAIKTTAAADQRLLQLRYLKNTKLIFCSPCPLSRSSTVIRLCSYRNYATAELGWVVFYFYFLLYSRRNPEPMWVIIDDMTLPCPSHLLKRSLFLTGSGDNIRATRLFVLTPRLRVALTENFVNLSLSQGSAAHVHRIVSMTSNPIDKKIYMLVAILYFRVDFCFSLIIHMDFNYINMRVSTACLLLRFIPHWKKILPFLEEPYIALVYYFSYSILLIFSDLTDSFFFI